MVPEATVIPYVAANLHLSAFPCITPASQLLTLVHQACLQSLSSTKAFRISLPSCCTHILRAASCCV